MANYTDNYNLILPEEADPYDVEDYNENFSTIDAALLSMENRIDTLAETAGSVIKSIQRFTLTKTISITDPVVQTIAPVDPDKCIVLIDYFYDRSGGQANISYTLTADSLIFTSDANNTGGLVTVHFQIVEFN